MYESSTISDTGTADPMRNDPGDSDSAGGSNSQSGSDAASAESDSAREMNELLENFPPEIATLLIMAGVAGVLLPGPVGAPLVIAGGLVYWPKTFRPIERWFSRKFPSLHREGVIQLKEFIVNLKRRYPEK